MSTYQTRIKAVGHHCRLWLWSWSHSRFFSALVESNLLSVGMQYVGLYRPLYDMPLENQKANADIIIWHLYILCFNCLALDLGP